MNIFHRVALTSVLLALSMAAVADLTGKVVAVADGDTFTLLTPTNDQVAIRLAEIDAPESGQPYGNRSKQQLSRLVFGQNVRVVVQTTDRYGRVVGRPYVGDVDVCREMVATGAAWAYRQYLREKNLLEVEAGAREAGRGLWGTTEAKAMPPWEWRRQGDSNSTSSCNIKGNINSRGERIYHVPGSRSYGATRINTAKGERWFCSEADARAAGWRPPRN